jgi:hypothetical protein
MARRKEDGTLANGKILRRRRFDVQYINNYYKKIKGIWYIFGNETLFPVNDEEIIRKIENELIINKSKGE